MEYFQKVLTSHQKWRNALLIIANYIQFPHVAPFEADPQMVYLEKRALYRVSYQKILIWLVLVVKHS
nr:CFF_HP1_G0009850.mRNA.1.CDS.1 [Saccharomyces cerevisiae]